MSTSKILIVDDEPTITRLLKLNLEQTGRFAVRTENRGDRAYPAALQFHPDLILLDVMMPDMDGGDVAAQIQADQQFKDVPILFLSAAVKQAEVEAHNGVIGGFPYIAKPLDVQGVISAIERLLPRKAA